MHVGSVFWPYGIAVEVEFSHVSRVVKGQDEVGPLIFRKREEILLNELSRSTGFRKQNEVNALDIIYTVATSTELEEQFFPPLRLWR